MADVFSRRAQMEAERLRRLQSTTKEQRVAEMERFVDELKEFGKKNFPHAPERWDEEEGEIYP